MKSGGKKDDLEGAVEEEVASKGAAAEKDSAVKEKTKTGKSKAKATEKKSGKPLSVFGKGKSKAGKTSKKVKKEKEQIAELEDRLLRLQADFDNFRKRTLKEKSELYGRAHAEVFEELLPVLDHMDMALESVGEREEDDAFVAGVRMVSEQFVQVLGKFGLDSIDGSGKEFDHNEHEAISHIPSAEADENMVIAQVRRGYKLGDRLLRPAQVVVSSGVADTEEQQVNEEG